MMVIKELSFSFESKVFLCYLLRGFIDIFSKMATDFYLPAKLSELNVFNPLTAVPAVMSLGLSSTSDVITFEQNWHHVYSSSTGGKDLSNNTWITVISLMEPEICTKMLKKLSDKLRAKFPATRRGYSMVKIAPVLLSTCNCSTLVFSTTLMAKWTS